MKMIKSAAVQITHMLEHGSTEIQLRISDMNGKRNQTSASNQFVTLISLYFQNLMRTVKYAKIVQNIQNVHMTIEVV